GTDTADRLRHARAGHAAHGRPRRVRRRPRPAPRTARRQHHRPTIAATHSTGGIMSVHRITHRIVIGFAAAAFLGCAGGDDAGSAGGAAATPDAAATTVTD